MSWKDPRLRNNNSYTFWLPVWLNRVWLIDEIPLSGKLGINIRFEGLPRAGIHDANGVHGANQESCLQAHSIAIVFAVAI